MDNEAYMPSFRDLRPLTHHKPGSQLRITQVRVCQEGTLLKHFFLLLSVSDAPGWTTSIIVYEADQINRGNTAVDDLVLGPVHGGSRACTTYPAHAGWRELMSKRGKVITLHSLQLHYSQRFTPGDFHRLAAQAHRLQHSAAQPEMPCRGFTELVWRAVHLQVEVPLPETIVEQRWARVSHRSRISDQSIAGIMRRAKTVGKEDGGEEVEYEKDDDELSGFALEEYDIEEL